MRVAVAGLGAALLGVGFGLYWASPASLVLGVTLMAAGGALGLAAWAICLRAMYLRSLPTCTDAQARQETKRRLQRAMAHVQPVPAVNHARTEVRHEEMILPNYADYAHDTAGLCRHYADIVARPGVYGSDTEVLAFERATGVRVRIWSVPTADPSSALLAYDADALPAGPAEPLAPRIDVLLDKTGVHYRLLEELDTPLPAGVPRPCLKLADYEVTNVRGDGNCLYYAMALGLRRKYEVKLDHTAMRALAVVGLRRAGDDLEDPLVMNIINQVAVAAPAA